MFRALVLSAIALSSSAFACTWTAKGRVIGPNGAVRFRVSNAPCPFQIAGQAAVVVTPPPLVYAAPPIYAPPPPVYAPPPVAYAQPPVAYVQPQYSTPPMPAPQVYAPTVIANPHVVAHAPAPVEDDRPSFLALKYMPGTSAAVGFDNGPQVGQFAFAHELGLELRFSKWFALRSDYEMRSSGRSWDMLGAKVWLVPSWFIKPYATVSISGSESYSLPGKYALGVVGGLGADLFLGKHFFIEAEARYRVAPGQGECCRAVPQFTALVGAGVAFF